MISSHEMAEFVWDASLRDMPLAITFPRATFADCIVKSMGLSDLQLRNIRVFAGNIAPSETPAQFSRSLCLWMDVRIRARACSDVRAQAWPHAVPNLISEWHGQSRHVQWIATGPMGNVAVALASKHSTEHPDAIVAACHQAASSEAPVTEANVKLDPVAFSAALELAQALNKPLLLILLNTSGYFCQWLAALSAECPTLQHRSFKSSMCAARCRCCQLLTVVIRSEFRFFTHVQYNELYDFPPECQDALFGLHVFQALRRCSLWLALTSVVIAFKRHVLQV